MTDVERLTIDYAAKASVHRESVKAYLALKSREMRKAAELHKNLADDFEIIAAALREKAERENGCDHCHLVETFYYGANGKKVSKLIEPPCCIKRRKLTGGMEHGD